jgi:hypothetical protein
MKITVGELKSLIREVGMQRANKMHETVGDLAASYGMPRSAEPALQRFMQEYPGSVKHMGDAQSLAEYLLFVDDMEGFDLRDAIIADNVRAIERAVSDILSEHPPETYNAFAGQGAVHPDIMRKRAAVN